MTHAAHSLSIASTASVRSDKSTNSSLSIAARSDISLESLDGRVDAAAQARIDHIIQEKKQELAALQEKLAGLEKTTRDLLGNPGFQHKIQPVKSTPASSAILEIKADLLEKGIVFNAEQVHSNDNRIDALLKERREKEEELAQLTFEINHFSS